MAYLACCFFVWNKDYMCFHCSCSLLCGYLSVWGPPLKYWRLGRYRYIFYRWVVDELCKRHIQGLVLDAGCGNCITSIASVPDGAAVVCVDVSKRNVRKSKCLCEENGKENFVYLLCSVDALPFRDETFDVVVSQDVIEHVPDNETLFKETFRVCRDGGWFVGSTSNLLNPFFLFDSLTFRPVASCLTRRFAGLNHYDRHTRLSVGGLMDGFLAAGFVGVGLFLVGYPLCNAPSFQWSSRKVPWYARLWVVFDKLTSRLGLDYLKENVVFCGMKPTG
jgi:SAM-dependent methyltransferase